MQASRVKRNDNIISIFCTALSVWLLAVAAFFAAREGLSTVLRGFADILFSPAQLITDYFRLGGVGATFLNAGLCGLACSLLIWINPTPARSRVLTGYFLVIAHCFYGLNLLNMWPCFFGVVVYCFVRKKKLGENLHSAMFATALAPFVSEFLFRYPNTDCVAGEVKWSVNGIALALVGSLLFGFLVPALVPGTAKMYRGFNLYKAGLAIGLFGFFIHSFFFKTLGVDTPSGLPTSGAVYEESTYLSLYIAFFGGLFLACILLGLLLSRGRLGTYREILRSSGHEVDFGEKFGMEICLINVGFVGIMMMLYFSGVTLLTGDAVFTGPTFGILFAAIAHTSAGQHPKNVYPLLIGYLLLWALTCGICAIEGLPVPWTPATQSYMNAAAFAVGLCPFTGKYGVKVGILAGAFSAVICTSTAALHGGFMLYNGGFTAGLTAMLLLPILDFFKVKELPCPENAGAHSTGLRFHTVQIHHNTNQKENNHE